MARGFLVLLIFLLVGEALARIGGLPIPGSVLGMVMLAVALNRRWVAESTVEPAARALIRNMGLLFVPAGAGIVLYGDLLRAQGLAIVVASVVSTLLVMAVVALLQQRLERR